MRQREASDAASGPGAPARGDAASDRYPVRLLVRPRPKPQGIEHGPEGRRERLRWDDVRAAVAAEVGEPQGVRTIVFELVVPRDEGAWEALRTDAEPGEEAMALARALEAGLTAGTPSLSIKSLATDALPTRWYPDLGAFEEAVAAWLADEVQGAVAAAPDAGGPRDGIR